VPNECDTKWLPWQRLLPSNRATKSAINGLIFQKQKVYKLPNITNSASRDQILEKIGQRSRSHGYIMYTAKMCHYSLLSSSYLGVTFESTHNYLGTNCLPCQRRLPSNRAKNSGLYDQFDHVL